MRIEQLNGKDRLSLTPLDKLDEPLSLVTLREQVESLLPRVDLPDAILEIHALTGFADEFTHISEGRGRVGDLALSICAVLVAEKVVLKIPVRWLHVWTMPSDHEHGASAFSEKG